MEHLTDTTVEELHRELAQIDGTKPTERLLAAIAYKHGVTQTELAAWFDVERKTIYNWLTRLEAREFESAVRDEHRPGRPRKLSADQLARFEAILQDPPTEAGYDVPAWTTELVQRLLHEEFDTDYSRPSCRRLMREAGLRHLTRREAMREVDPDEREAFDRAADTPGHVWLPG